MDIARAFKAIFADPRWVKKMLLAGVVSLVPILNFAIGGYYLTYQRNVAEGRDEELPDWSELGDYWMLGLQVVGAGFVYALPIIIGSMALIVGPIALAGNSDEAFGAILCGVFAMYAFMFVGIVILAVLIVAMTTHFNYYRQFGAFFRFGEVWRLVKANAGMYFGALGMSWVVSMVMSMIITPISYVASFAMFPFMSSMESSPESAFVALAVMMVVYFVIMVIMMFAYIPAYHVIYHYFGQYMARAYGMSPVVPAVPTAQPGPREAPGSEDDVLPPPPPSVAGPTG